MHNWQSKNKKKIIIVAGTILVIIIAAVLVVNFYNHHSDFEDENIDIVDTEKNTSIYYDENLPADALNIKEVVNIFGIEGMSSIGIYDSESLPTEYLDKLGITYYQAFDMIYQKLYTENKLPKIYGYTLELSPGIELDPTYSQRIIYLAKANIVTADLFTEGFNGYDYIPKTTFNELVDKMNIWLESCSQDELVDLSDFEQTEEEQQQAEDELEADKILIEQELQETEFVDRLSGQSVAIYEHPKNYDELNANLDNIIPVDVNKISTLIDDFTQLSTVDIEYINIDQAFIDPNGVLDYYDRVFNAENPKSKIDMLGVTVAKVSGFEVGYYMDSYTISFDELDDLYNYVVGLSIDAFTVKNNKIMELAYLGLDQVNPLNDDGTAHHALAVRETDYDFDGILILQVTDTPEESNVQYGIYIEMPQEVINQIHNMHRDFFVGEGDT